MRLFQAAANSPLDIDLVTGEDGVPCVLVYRCGWAHASYRIEKSDGYWVGFDLEAGGKAPAFQSRLPGDVIAAMSDASPKRGRPSAS